MNRSGRIRAEGGFDYWVSDAQLDACGRLTPPHRLEWLEQARCFVVAYLTPVARERQERLRRGEPVA